MCIYCFLAGISTINEQLNSSTTVPIENNDSQSNNTPSTSEEDEIDQDKGTDSKEKTQATLKGRLMMIFLSFFSSSSDIIILKKA